MKLIFLKSFGSKIQLTQQDLESPEKIDSIYNQTLNQFYEALQKQSLHTLTSKKIKENLLSFQKQLENPRYDFKGLEFEAYNEDIIKGQFSAAAFELSKAFYVEKLSMFFQSSNITNENIQTLSLIYVLNKNITNMKLYIGQNQITNIAIFYILIALALNKNIRSIELEYNNCDNLQLEQTTRLLSSFLHYKSQNGQLVEVNISGGFSLIKQPLFPSNLKTLQKIDLHVSNKIIKTDDLLINICSGLENNLNLQTFSLDFKNNKLTSRGIQTLAKVLSPQGHESQLKELKLSLSAVEENSNAYQGLPILGQVLSNMKELYKLELNLNDFQMESQYFGSFLDHLKNKKGLQLSWFFISYLDNPKIQFQDEIILGEIFSKNYILYGQNLDITNNVIKICNKTISQQEEESLTYDTIKQIGESVSNFANCSTLDLIQFRASGNIRQQRLLKYIHISAGCNTKSFISRIEDNNLHQWGKLDNYLMINKLQVMAIYKQFQDLFPVYLPQIIYDIREDMDVALINSFYI